MGVEIEHIVARQAVSVQYRRVTDRTTAVMTMMVAFGWDLAQSRRRLAFTAPACMSPSTMPTHIVY